MLEINDVQQIKSSVAALVVKAQRKHQKPILLKINAVGEGVLCSLIDSSGNLLFGFDNFYHFVMEVQKAGMSAAEAIQLNMSLKIPDIRQMVESAINEGEKDALSKLVEIRASEGAEKGFILCGILHGEIRFFLFDHTGKANSPGKQIREITQKEINSFFGRSGMENESAKLFEEE